MPIIGACAVPNKKPNERGRCSHKRWSYVLFCNTHAPKWHTACSIQGMTEAGAIEAGKKLWAFMNRPPSSGWEHVNWGPIPVLLIHSEAQAIDYYRQYGDRGQV